MFSEAPMSAEELEYAATIAPRSLARSSAVQFVNRRRQREDVAALTAHAVALPRMLFPSNIVPT
jgi:hypothetical protein